MSAVLTRTQIWSVPIILGGVSVVGLVAALLADGLWDIVSWVALAAPVAVCVHDLWRPHR